MTKIAQKDTNSKNAPGKQFANVANSANFESAQNVLISPPLFNTSAQLCTDPQTKSPQTLTRRAKAKFITNGLILPLIDLDSPLQKSYWRTWHCTNVLLQEGQKITSQYCNNRWCIVCNRIRTAKMIEKYYPVIKAEMPNLYFVSLTIVSVPGDKLKDSIEDMIQTFQRIKNKMRMRDQVNIKGIRKLEVTYNPTRHDFHPHLHFLIEGKTQAEQLRKEWLLRYPTSNPAGQDVVKADDGSIIELLKYTAKLVHKDDYRKLDDGRIEVKIQVKALDTIFTALRNKRTYQGFGIRLKLNEDVSELDSEVYEDILSDIDVWTWDQDNSDWISTYGEILTGCDAHKIYQVVQAKQLR